MNLTKEKWFAELMSDEEKGRLTALSLVHKIGQSEDIVYALKLGDKQWNLKELADIFQHKAEIRVQAEPGSHLFHILAFYDSNEPQGRYPFRVNSSADLGAGATEEPTERGVTSQKMRHAEAGFQFAFKHSQELVRMTLEMNRDLMKYNRDITLENADALKMVKEICLAQALNNHQLKMEEFKVMQGMRREDQLMKYLPAIANTVAGREVFPQSSQDTALVEMLLSTASEDTIKLLASSLPPEAQGLIAARASQFYQERKKAVELAEQAALSRASMNGNGNEVDHELGNDSPEEAAKH